VTGLLKRVNNITLKITHLTKKQIIVYENFSGRQQRQDVKVFPTFQELPPYPYLRCADGLREPKLLTIF